MNPVLSQDQPTPVSPLFALSLLLLLFTSACDREPEPSPLTWAGTYEGWYTYRVHGENAIYDDMGTILRYEVHNEYWTVDTTIQVQWHNQTVLSFSEGLLMDMDTAGSSVRISENCMTQITPIDSGRIEDKACLEAEIDRITLSQYQDLLDVNQRKRGISIVFFGQRIR